MGGACSAYCGEEKRGIYRVLVGKPEGKRPLRRLTLKWVDNIKMDLEEVGRVLWGLDGVGFRIGTCGGRL